jgi:PAS domain S-box-containing protein
MSNIRRFLDGLTREQLLVRLSLALDGGDVGIWDWDLRDNSVQFDRRWCEMLGLDHSATPMTLATWESRVHPDDLAACYRDIQAHVAGATSRYENVHRMRHANGEWVHILDRGRIAEFDADGKPVRFTGTHLDVTVTERARALLAQERERLHTLVAEMPVGVALLGPGDTLLAASPRWAAALGLDAPPAPGTPLAEAAPALALAEVFAPEIARARAGESRFAEEAALPAPTGEPPRWVRWHLRPQVGEPASTPDVVFSVEDVTAQVEARTAAIREEEARVESLALFAGGIAHEINSPLQILLTEAELAAASLQAGAPEDTIAASIATIQSTAARAAAITRALRTLSRDARHDEPAAVSAAAILADAEALLSSRFASGGVPLQVSRPVALPALRGRPAEVLHALLNLLHNAYDAVRAAGRANTPGGDVHLACAVTDSHVVFTVDDGGDGIPVAHHGRVFTPFFTTRPVGVGTGLGLPIARRLAERDGGFLVLDPTPPRTTFRLGFPVHHGG